MSKPTLLREYIRLVLETPSPMQPFVIRGPVKRVKYSHGSSEFAIYREFPVVMDPGMMDALKVTPDELENGAVTGEHEVIIDVDVDFRRSRFKGSHFQPPDPDEWDLSEWTVVSIDGFELSPEDASALKGYLGDLTDREVEGIQETWYERGGDEPPDPPDYDDDY